MNSANQIILNYLESLGTLAANDISKFDKELNGINASLQSLPGLGISEKKEAFDAGTAITNFLFKAATDAYRREQLRIAVTTVDKPLKTLVNLLDKAVNKNYIKGILENESLAVDFYYRNYLGRLLTAPRGENTAKQVEAEISKDNEWRSASKTIDDKKALATGYLNLLKKISTDHSTLYKMYVKGEDPAPSLVKQMIGKYSKDLKSLSEKSEKLSLQN